MDKPFPGMAVIRSNYGKTPGINELAKITRKCARGVDRSGSAKRPHFRFVRQSVSCGRHAKGRQPLSLLLGGCGRVKGNNAASNHSSAWPLSENLTRALLSVSPSISAPYASIPPLHSRFLFTLFASFNGGTRVIAVSLNFKKKSSHGCAVFVSYCSDRKNDGARKK